MSKDNPDNLEPISEYIPPQESEDYLVHERFLRRRYGKGIMLSIQKEIEGMARLYSTIEKELDKEDTDKLLKHVNRQVEVLRGVEDEVAACDTSVDVESRSH